MRCPTIVDYLLMGLTYLSAAKMLVTSKGGDLLCPSMNMNAHLVDTDLRNGKRTSKIGKLHVACAGLRQRGSYQIPLLF